MSVAAACVIVMMIRECLRSAVSELFFLDRRSCRWAMTVSEVNVWLYMWLNYMVKAKGGLASPRKAHHKMRS